MGNSFEIEGKIKVINDIQSFDSGFTKREFVVEVPDGNYPQMIKFECVKEKTSLTDGLEIDDAVKVTFDIRGNEYKGRYYVNLNAWKIESSGGGGDSSGAPDDPPPSSFDSSFDSEPDPSDDDIPF